MPYPINTVGSPEFPEPPLVYESLAGGSPVVAESRTMSDALVQVSNHASRDIFIRGDPNWDDQILMLDGRPKTTLHRLAPGHSAELAVPSEDNGEIDEYALGVIIADGRDFDYGSAGAYQTTIGRQTETGWLGVTDESVINEPAVRYSATSEGPRTMRIEFVDARERALADTR